MIKDNISVYFGGAIIDASVLIKGITVSYTTGGVPECMVVLTPGYQLVGRSTKETISINVTQDGKSLPVFTGIVVAADFDSIANETTLTCQKGV